MPVMEGKALLFKEFGGVDAWPICLATKDPTRSSRSCKAIAPGFGGINLEDISAPRCFEIEARLRDELDIPVFHDDQHGTAIVVLAALLNALKVVGKRIEDVKIVTTGVGAAGVATTDIAPQRRSPRRDRLRPRGAVYRGRPGLAPHQGGLRRAHESRERELAAPTRRSPEPTSSSASRRRVLSRRPGCGRWRRTRSSSRWPTRRPRSRRRSSTPGVAVVATGRSDYPNQINNVLAFPGVFRGALDVRATTITEGDEGRRRARDRVRDRAPTSSGTSTSSRASSTATSPRASRQPWPRQPSGRAPPAGRPRLTTRMRAPRADRASPRGAPGRSRRRSRRGSPRSRTRSPGSSGTRTR